MLRELIQEEVGKMMDTKITSVDAIPKTIFRVLSSQACHGTMVEIFVYLLVYTYYYIKCLNVRVGFTFLGVVYFRCYQIWR